MPETLTSADGNPIEVDPGEREFAAAMAAPEPDQPRRPGPKRRDPEAPHGRELDGTPKAPYGLKPDGTPRMTPGGPGRGKTGPQAGSRVQKPASKAPPRAATAAPESAADARARRAADAETALNLLSAGGTLLSMFSLSRASVAHKAAEAKGDKAAVQRAATAYKRAQVMQLDAAACAIHAEGVGASAAEAAAANSFAAALVDRLALFNGAASVGLAMLPLVYQIIANHAPAEATENFPPELMTLGVLPPSLLLEKLQAQNAVKMAKAQSEILREKEEAVNELNQLREQNAA